MSADRDWHLKLKKGDRVIIARQMEKNENVDLPRVPDFVIGSTAKIVEPFHNPPMKADRLAIVTDCIGQYRWVSPDMLDPAAVEIKDAPYLRVVASSAPLNRRQIVEGFAHSLDLEMIALRRRHQTPLQEKIYALLKSLRDAALALAGDGEYDETTLEAAAQVAEAHRADEPETVRAINYRNDIAAKIRRLNLPTRKKTEA